ncbi:MAG TPA: Ig domain-containing protein, partial [Candidatus Limnocylindrales bacterium]|nr:Ig domain-containing protein [Candidatus Limnocylindrales bacterium]
MHRVKSTILILAAAVSAAGLLVAGAAATSIDKSQPPSGAVGEPYSFRINTGKGSFSNGMTWNVNSGAFPPGLRLSYDGEQHDGVSWVDIVGTPTTPGFYKFYIQAVDTDYNEKNNANIHVEEQYVINIAPAKARLVVTTTSLPAGLINQPYTAPALTASGGTVSSWDIAGGALPPGLSLAPNGVISGTPTQSGTFNVVVRANGSGTSDTHQLALVVAAPLGLQTLVNRTPPARGLTAKKAVGVQLKTGVKAVGGRPPYAFPADGSLPPGLTLDSATGLISGAGTTAGRYPFTVTVTDGTGAKVSVEWNITILALIDFAKGKGLPAGRVDSEYSARIPVRGKDAKTAQFAVAGEIPPGLDVGEDGRLT